MKRIKIFIAVLFGILLLGACQQEEKLDPNKAYPNFYPEKTELDNWVYENFTVPWNMSVRYKWDHNEVEYTKTLVPVEEWRVKPIMKMIEKIWIEPYVEIAGETFVKEWCPKKYVLIGSPEYNNGTITLGEAEGGIKVTLYRLNWVTTDNRSIICEVMKTVHHEFAHILHQQIMYPTEFEAITAAGYTTSWSQSSNTEEDARDGGFISRYARASPSEDFVEMIARIAVYGHDAFMARVNAASEEGATAMLKKEEMIVNYLYDVWGIRFYDSVSGDVGLVTLVQNAIDAVVAGEI